MPRKLKVASFGNALSAGRAAVVQQLERRTLLSAGAFDPTFGTNGTADAGTNSYLAVANLPNGKIIAVINTSPADPSFNAPELARFDRHGNLDRSFGKGGFAPITTTPNSTLSYPAIAIQRDGKILVTGGFNDSGHVFRFLQNGKPDKAFGTSGVVTLSTLGPTIQNIEGIGLQSHGQILVAGYGVKQRTNPLLGAYEEFAVARLTGNGKLDPIFGTGGETITDFGGTVSSLDTGAAPASMLVQKDGRIVVAGPVIEATSLAFARYSADGEIDPTFGASGIEILNNLTMGTGGHFDMSQQADGKIVVPLVGGVGRLTTAGALDPSFGVGGIASLPASPMSFTQVQSVAVQNDGMIVGFGSSDFPLVARWNPDGALDTTFGGSGVVMAQSPFFPTGAENVGGFIQKNGDILALSTSGLMAYTPTGQLDAKFGHRGVAWNTNGLTGQIDAAALQKNEKILVAGSELAVDAGSPTEAALARYNADGSLDRTFGNDGRVYVTVGNNANFDSLLIQKDGKIVAGGFGQVGGTREFLVVRLTPGGRLDRSFHRNGVLTSAFGSAASQAVAAVAIGPGKTIVAAGSADQQIAVERILGNGRLDPSFATGGQFAGQPLGQASAGSGLVVGSDGRITVGGTIGNNFGVIRLLANGTFDAAFGIGGIVTTAFTDRSGAPTPSEANALITDANGDLILGGSTGGFDPSDPLLPLGSFAFARYRNDGTLDPSFGIGGKITQRFGPGGTNIDGDPNNAGEFFLVDSLAVQKDGKILAGGLVSGDVAVARLTDSSLDTTFSNLGLDAQNGTLPTPGIAILGQQGFPGKPDDAPVTSVLVQPDGKIVAVHGTEITRLTAT